jgi:hypothetical protein
MPYIIGEGLEYNAPYDTDNASEEAYRRGFEI